MGPGQPLPIHSLVLSLHPLLSQYLTSRPHVSSGSPTPHMLRTRFPRPPHSPAPLSGIGRGSIPSVIGERLFPSRSWTPLPILTIPSFFAFCDSFPELASIPCPSWSQPPSMRHGAALEGRRTEAFEGLGEGHKVCCRHSWGAHGREGLGPRRVRGKVRARLGAQLSILSS